MQFNEFNRRLKDANVSPQLSFLMTHLFEVMVEVNKQMNTLTSLQVKLAESLQNIVHLSEADRRLMSQAMGFGKMEGIEVSSVANDPEKQ